MSDAAREAVELLHQNKVRGIEEVVTIDNREKLGSYLVWNSRTNLLKAWSYLRIRSEQRIPLGSLLAGNSHFTRAALPSPHAS